MEQFNTKWHLPFKLFSISITLWLVLPSVFQYGIFVDGAIYASISHQLANGKGDFWHLFYSKIVCNEFYRHPPLAIYLHSLLYYFSNSFIVDKLYSFLTLLLNIYGIVLSWIVISEKNYKNFWWIPVILYSVVLLISWAFKNNMLENTMSVFCIFSFYFFMLSYYKNNYIYLILASIMICFAFLSKGLTGLFPLAFPFILFFSKIDFNAKRFFSFIIILYSLVGLFAIGLYLNPNSNHYFTQYFNAQLIKSLTRKFNNDSDGFFIVSKTLLELIPIFSITTIIMSYAYFKKQLIAIPKKNIIQLKLLIIIALSATLPILLSPRQSGYYALCAYPFFSLAFGQLILPQVDFYFKKLTPNSAKLKLVSSFSILILISSMIFSINKYKCFERDETTLKDIFTICNYLPP